MKASYDVVIVGAGPAGSTAAAFAARHGLDVLLVDKAVFPRDKVCGDAVSGKSMDVLRRLNLVQALASAEQVGSEGIVFGAPGGETVAIPFRGPSQSNHFPGYVCARSVFDNLLVKEAQRSGADLVMQAEVAGVLKSGDTVQGVKLRQRSGVVEIRSRIVLGADGAYSAVSRDLGHSQYVASHYCAGVRAYCEQVSGFHPGNFIELHFVPGVLPGYFWIFPMANGRANVGIGMLSSEIKRKGVNLRRALDRLIHDSRFAARFERGASRSQFKGWGLPLGSQPKPMAGSGWMLVGDAASLIDPFTGEGIGNAMISGELAADWAKSAFEAGRFDSAFLAEYERDVLDKLGEELRISRKLQRLVRQSWLFDLVVRKANRSERIATTISAMFDDESKRRSLMSPLFYLRLLLA